jgi:hypothetical protein
VLDYGKPLSCGGADSPSNIEGKTIEEARLRIRLNGRVAASAPWAYP